MISSPSGQVDHARDDGVGEGGKSMTLATIDLFGMAASGLHPVGERIAAWHRQVPAKVLARDFAVAVATAKSWKGGHLPQMSHFTVMVRRYGVDFLDFVFAPALDDLPDMAGRLDRMERQAARFAADLAELKRQVEHEGLASDGGGVADQRGGSGGGVAQPLRPRRSLVPGSLVGRAVAGLLALALFGGPILEVLSSGPAALVAVVDDDGKSRPMRLAKRWGRWEAA
jgi:hypothetical protein